MNTSIQTLIFCGGLLAATTFTPAVYASVSETDGLGTSWLGTPTFETAASPTTFTTAEGNFGTGGTAGNGALAQSFELSSGGTLSTLQLYLAGSAITYKVELFDLGAYPASGYPSTTASFTPGTANDLLTAGDSFTYNGGAGGASSIAQLTFSGADASITLLPGELYALEIDPTTAATASQWVRDGVQTVNGQAYRGAGTTTGALNGAIRDFGFAATVTPVPEPTSLALLGGALAAAGFIRRRKS